MCALQPGPRDLGFIGDISIGHGIIYIYIYPICFFCQHSYANQNGPIEIVSFPFKLVMFHGYGKVYKRVNGA